MTQAENFRNFLVKNKAYDIFCAEVLLHRGLTFEDITTDIMSFSGIIDANLHWTHTANGENYWFKLDKVWNQACRLGIKFFGEYKSIW